MCLLLYLFLRLINIAIQIGEHDDDCSRAREDRFHYPFLERYDMLDMSDLFLIAARALLCLEPHAEKEIKTEEMILAGMLSAFRDVNPHHTETNRNTDVHLVRQDLQRLPTPPHCALPIPSRAQRQSAKLAGTDATDPSQQRGGGVQRGDGAQGETLARGKVYQPRVAAAAVRPPFARARNRCPADIISLRKRCATVPPQINISRYSTADSPFPSRSRSP